MKDKLKLTPKSIQSKLPSLSCITNKFGQPQYLNGDGDPVCPECMSYVLWNNGQGTSCSACQTREFLEQAADYAAGQ